MKNLEATLEDASAEEGRRNVAIEQAKMEAAAALKSLRESHDAELAELEERRAAETAAFSAAAATAAATAAAKAAADMAAAVEAATAAATTAAAAAIEALEKDR